MCKMQFSHDTAHLQAEQHARETLAQSIERKARKAHQDRVKKEREQKKNIKKYVFSLFVCSEIKIYPPVCVILICMQDL